MPEHPPLAVDDAGRCRTSPPGGRSRGTPVRTESIAQAPPVQAGLSRATKRRKASPATSRAQALRSRGPARRRRVRRDRKPWSIGERRLRIGREEGDRPCERGFIAKTAALISERPDLRDRGREDEQVAHPGRARAAEGGPPSPGPRRAATRLEGRGLGWSGSDGSEAGAHADLVDQALRRPAAEQPRRRDRCRCARGSPASRTRSGGRRRPSPAAARVHPASAPTARPSSSSTRSATVSARIVEVLARAGRVDVGEGRCASARPRRC